MSLAPDDPRHGTVNGYINLRCRCAPCREAGSAYQRERQGWKKWRAKNLARGLTSRGTPYKSRAAHRRATGL